MNTSISQIELIVSAEDDRELWAIVPSLPVQDWPSVQSQLPADYQDYELADFAPVRVDNQFFDGWVLRPAAA